MLSLRPSAAALVSVGEDQEDDRHGSSGSSISASEEECVATAVEVARDRLHRFSNGGASNVHSLFDCRSW